MASNLIEAVEARLTPDIVGKLSSAVGETPAKTSSAVSAMVPSIFGALIHKGSTESGVTGLLSGLKDFQAAQTFGEASEPKGIMAKGSRLASSMLGSGGGRIVDLISNTSGVRRESSMGIMSFVFPLALGALGKQVMSRGLGAVGLSELLASQKKAVLDHPMVPKGLHSALGLSDIAHLGGSSAEVPEPHVSVGRVMSQAPPPMSRVENRYASPPPKTPWSAILGALAIGALVIGGLIYFTGNSRRAQLNDTPAPLVERQPPAVQPVTPDIPPPEPTSQTSLTGATMDEPNDVAGAAKDKAKAVDKESPTTLAEGDLRMQFDRTSGALPERVTLPNVNFESGSTKFVEGADASIDTLAEAMKAHPSARIRLEGYTDSTGAADINAPLSKARAKVVKDKLVDKGIEADRIETVGRSAERPVADNDSTEGRQENRRTDILILRR